MATSTPPKRFKMEPVETTIKSSKDRSHNDTESSKRLRKFTPEPVETTTKSSRRFAPKPIEMSVGSSKDRLDADAEGSTRPRKFAPEPVETSTRTNRRAEPEPVEASRRRRKSGGKFAEEWKEWESQISLNDRKKEKRQSRKFTPQLIETARRSRKAGDKSPTLRPSDKTEATPVGSSGTQITVDTSNLTVPSPPTNTPTFDYSQNPLFLEIQRATSPFSRRRSMPRRVSKHCFQVPDLDPIESSESEESNPSSPTTSPSITSDRPCFYKEATRMRESVDERFSGYLLKLAADAAEKQLREQALAAFPNDDYHETVDHWVDRDDEADSNVDDAQSRRDSSFNEVNWELIAMRKHRERLEQQQEEERERERRREIEGKQNAWRNVAAYTDSSPKDIIGGYQKDGELDRMRRGARPPMLGRDIKFPRCPSPEPARFDTTQGCDVVRKAMCYLNEQSQAAEKGESLWCGNGNGKQLSKVPSLWSTGSSRSASRSGLWGGCCVTSGDTPPRGPTGILTPSNEKGNPVDTPCPTPSASILPPTPPASHADFACIDEKLAVELSIEEEYGDDFVTQVYNYLSLGYPSMARPFDPELSKISNIPIADLRQDDHLAQSRGYIRLGADGNLTSAEITEESCMRWRALRIYIREWAKQHPGMAGETQGMGTAVRRGSWAV
ncbi:hypothetical protein K458DRAFT_306818 [Lentithecium fluviatile CBS 122367]|uniref:Uncharacterized protein n=1 Tax=Lentithecium fluviatile CBS 122367 TaxID=1168545 RepID=A0A6G1IX22_9PLEO|nr:hypothetical protein K458DRAFT_306818 [Lentithecium fluviatile CBS 122367]